MQRNGTFEWHCFYLSFFVVYNFLYVFFVVVHFTVSLYFPGRYGRAAPLLGRPQKNTRELSEHNVSVVVRETLIRYTHYGFIVHKQARSNMCPQTRVCTLYMALFLSSHNIVDRFSGAWRNSGVQTFVCTTCRRARCRRRPGGRHRALPELCLEQKRAPETRMHRALWLVWHTKQLKLNGRARPTERDIERERPRQMLCAMCRSKRRKKKHNCVYICI